MKEEHEGEPDRDRTCAGGRVAGGLARQAAKAAGATVTVRIEDDAEAAMPAERFMTDDPLFGMWRDREDMANVAGYIRSIRTSRFDDDSAQRKE